MNFKKLIENKTVCEIRSDNDFQTFDVGIIFHDNEHSVFAKCFGKEGEFSGYEMLPRDYIRSVSYGTKYIDDLKLQDLSIDEEFNFSEWDCPEDVFEFLKKDEAMVSFYDYESTEMVKGIIVDFDEDSVTLKVFDDEINDFDGVMIFSTNNYFCLEWGK